MTRPNQARLFTSTVHPRSRTAELIRTLDLNRILARVGRMTESDEYAIYRATDSWLRHR